MTTTIRCSALSDYPDCNRRGAARLFWSIITDMGFRLRYLPRSAAAAIGTAVHAGVSIALAEKATTGALPPLTVPQDAARDVLYDLADGEGIVFDGKHGPTRTFRDAGNQVASMTRVYHVVTAPTVEPVITEKRLEAEVEPGLILSGQPDLVAREPHQVRDLKTGVRPPGNPAPQLGGYSLLSRSHGMEIDHVVIDFVRRVPPNKPQPDPVSMSHEIARAESAASAVMRNIARDLDTFLHGDEKRRIRPGDVWSFAANPSSILCSEKFCPAWGTDFCAEGSRAKEGS